MHHPDALPIYTWLHSPRAGGESELYWIENKNPEAPAVKREAEEDWGA
jgi:hypothetical protein